MKKIIAPALVCSIALLGGCKKKELQVNLPSNFHGPVVIACGLGKQTGNAVDVDSRGYGTAATCASGTHLVIRQNGQTIQPSGAPEAMRTGDGIMTAIQFSVP